MSTGTSPERACKGLDVKVTLVPHLLPMKQGHIDDCLRQSKKIRANVGGFSTFTGRRTGMSRLCASCPRGRFPIPGFVRYSNYCDIALKSFEDGRLILVSAIDNLLKGASGQAVQDMNIALGPEERAGLTFSSPISLK